MLKPLRRRLTIIFAALTSAVLAVALLFAMDMAIAQQGDNISLNYDVAVSAVTSYVAGAGGDFSDGALTALESEYGLVLRVYADGEEVEFEPGWEINSDREMLVQQAQEIVDTEGLWEGTEWDGYFTIITTAAAADTADDTAYLEEGEYEYDYDYEEAIAGEIAGVEIVRGQEAGDTDGVDGEEAETFIIENQQFVMLASLRYDDYEAMYVNGESGELYRVTGLMIEDDESYYDVTILHDQDYAGGQLVSIYLTFCLMFLLGAAVLTFISYWLARMVVKPTEKSLQQQADFVAAASHELRSPLAVVRASLSAADAAPDDEQAKKYRAAADDEAQRMSRLVDDLLLLAGGDAGTWKVSSEAVDLDTLLIETAEHYKPLVKKNGQTLLLRLPEDTLPPVRGDADRLRQILAVLLDNAMQYAPKGTGISLAARAKKNRVDIEVVDQGDGIPDAQKPQVFERFYQADTSRTDKKHFGLGLSVAKELAVLHGGSLSVHDTTGGGATFRLSLQVKQQKEAPSREEKAEPTAAQPEE